MARFCTKRDVVNTISQFLRGADWVSRDLVQSLRRQELNRSLVYLKSPYNDLLPLAFDDKNVETIAGFKALTGSVIEFQGLRGRTVIAYHDGQEKNRLMYRMTIFIL